jgi:hypothetical protein|uniref:Uncharacterized protein n=1 Tax=Globisporangium ultimum (strain ATCC 200006 / CBS 805.95 / DAOM BR144) TaxID=431595 RepID=K3W5A2_GLOUD
MKTHDMNAELVRACAIPVTPDEATVDANGISIYKWSHPLRDHDDCYGEPTGCRYACCACFPFAQIQSRMGFETFGESLWFYIAVVGTMWVATIAASIYILFWSNGSMTNVIVGLVAGLVTLLLFTVLFVHHIASLRARARARFQIPGTEEEDRRLALWQSSRALRQMVRHLQLEHVGTFAKVDTMPAYK